MIYFLDNSLQLQKIVTSKNTGDIMHYEELNGLIHGNVELDLSYANKFLILGIDHVGYYYKDEFYLHKIQRVEYDHVNESVKVVFRHIFFEDMLFGPIIKDVRPKNQDAVTILRQTIEANTRWQIVMTDVTGTLSTNFYWQVPYEVIEFVNKNFRVDMFPKILFDGKNINGFQLHVKNGLSSEVKQRIPFGSRVLDLKYEEDFSEIVTKLVGHGKGEEVGDGYGRRINFSEINFNRNGVKSPVGSVYMEDPSITNTYGNDGQTPREGRVVFEDIESPTELAEATYQHYLDVSRPQMLFTADVADIGDVNIGDSVLIVRREYDVYFKARIHKLSVNLLNPEDAQVELGDYEHFKESKVERKSREKNNRVQKQLSDRIARLKREANDFIDGEFSQALSEFEQNLIDQKAQIEADRVNMTNKIETARTDLTNAINTEVTQAKDYAEQQAQAKADKVRTDLETVTSGHQALIDGLKDNVLNIDTFLGDKSKTLAKQFSEMESGLNQSITAESGRIDAIVTNFGDSGKSLTQFVLDVDSIETTVAKNDAWLGTYGSAAEQTIAGFEQKVWNTDIANIGANLIPMSSNAWESGSFWTSGTNNNGSNGIRTKSYIEVTPGESYTLHDHSEYVSAILEIQIVQWDGENRIGITDFVNRRNTRTFTAQGDRIRIGLTPISGFGINPTFVDNPDGRIKMKLEKGRTATPIMNALSRIEQLANSVSIAVQELDLGTGYLKQTDFQLTPDYWQLGAMRIGAENVSSVLRGSRDALDAVVSNFNLTGNLNAKGQITSLAVDAIEGNFARLFANQLTANVITSDHIQVGTALIDKFFATSARIDRLISKTHFVNEMHALTLNVVDLNASQIRTRLLSANTIEAEWLKGGTALLDKVFASTAMFERMMAKSAFVTTLSTVTLDLHELTIWRPDGVPYVQNGVPSFGIPVFFKPWMPADGTVTFDGRNYNTSMAGTQTFEMGYTQHAGRYLSIAFSANLRFNSTSTSTYMGVVVRFINKPSGTSIRDVIKDDILVFRDHPSNEFQINVPLGSPTYGGLAVQLEFYRIGGTSNNIVQIRTGRAWING